MQCAFINCNFRIQNLFPRSVLSFWSLCIKQVLVLQSRVFPEDIFDSTSWVIQISIFRLFAMFPLLTTIADITHSTKFGWVHSGNDMVKHRASKFCQACSDGFVLLFQFFQKNVGNLSLEQGPTHPVHVTKSLKCYLLLISTVVLSKYFSILGGNIFWVRWAHAITFI